MSIELEDQRAEVFKLLRTARLTTEEVFGLSLLCQDKEDASRCLSAMRKDGVIRKEGKYWVSAGTDHVIHDLMHKCTLLQRLAEFAAPDIAEKLREIEDDLRHASV